MKNFKEYISGKSGYGFREIINELTDDELSDRVADYIQTEFKLLNIPDVINSVCKHENTVRTNVGVINCIRCGAAILKQTDL